MIKFLKRKLGAPYKGHQIVDVPITKDINTVFGDISKEMDMMRRWVMHINSRGDYVHRRHNSHVEITKKELGNITRWIDYLRGDINHLKSIVKQTTGYILETHKHHKEMHERVNKLEKEIEESKQRQRIKEGKRTSDRGQQRTSQGQNKDTTEDNKIWPKRAIAPQAIKVVDRNAMNPSQEELLKLLYEADRPLDYGTMARILRKKEKSIRNLIYEIRDKGIEIKDQPIGFRKKGFFLEEAQKIRISGR